MCVPSSDPQLWTQKYSRVGRTSHQYVLFQKVVSQFPNNILLQPIYLMHLFVNFHCHRVMSVCADLYHNILLLSFDHLHNLLASSKIEFSNYILIYLSNLPARVAAPVTGKSSYCIVFSSHHSTALFVSFKYHATIYHHSYFNLFHVRRFQYATIYYLRRT